MSEKSTVAVLHDDRFEMATIAIGMVVVQSLVLVSVPVHQALLLAPIAAIIGAVVAAVSLEAIQ